MYKATAVGNALSPCHVHGSSYTIADWYTLRLTFLHGFPVIPQKNVKSVSCFAKGVMAV